MKTLFNDKRILIHVNAEWYFRLHWLPLIQGLKKTYNEIIVVTSDERNETELIRQSKIRVILLPYPRSTFNPIIELLKIYSLAKIFYTVRPDIVHNITIKPMIYGTIAARLMTIPSIINSITGLGYTFIQSGKLGKLLKSFIIASYRRIFSKPNIFLSFQNPEDKLLFLDHGVMLEKSSNVILGVGVNTKKFAPKPLPQGQKRIMMATRMLWDKGVAEFVAAAKLLRKINPELKMTLVGTPDIANPQSVSEAELENWHNEGNIDYWGFRNDMPEVIRSAYIIVLPSYREGLPTILIESASVGRPIIATDVPGCREVVQDGVNGYLVPPRNSQLLAEKINLIACDSQLAESMGAASVEIANHKFEYKKVLSKYSDLYASL